MVCVNEGGIAFAAGCRAVTDQVLLLPCPPSQVVGKALPYDTVKGVRARLAEVAPHFAVINNAHGAVWMNGEYMKALGSGAAAAAAGSSAPLATPIANFFMTDAISRASQTMAKCVQARQRS